MRKDMSQRDIRRVRTLFLDMPSQQGWLCAQPTGMAVCRTEKALVVELWNAALDAAGTAVADPHIYAASGQQPTVRLVAKSAPAGTCMTCMLTCS